MVLGQIIRRRGYGYELADRLREWSEALELSESAIYAALRSLEAKGLIVEVGQDAPEQDRRRSNVRLIYEATAKGQDSFQRWMAGAPKKRPLREELHMQLMVAEDDDIPALLEGLRQMEEDCRADLARIIGCAFDSRRSAHARISSFGAPLVQDGLISHLQNTMEWAQRSRRALQNHLDGRSSSVSERQRP